MESGLSEAVLRSSMTRSSRYSDDDIRAAVVASVSIAGVMRLLGIKPAGGSHFNISRRIKRLELDTSHFTGQGHNAGKVLDRRGPDHFLRRLNPSGNRTAAKYLRRSMIEMGVPLACVWCEVPAQWRGSPLVLHVDHIDGDPWNCELNNLRFLCPNCHSQTSTYCRSARPSERRGAAA